MKLKKYIIILLHIISLYGCERQEETPCHDLINLLEGTYEITITTYKRQPGIEGDTKDILVFLDLDKCYSSDENKFDIIQFNNLFGFFECTKHELINQSEFVIKYEDNIRWFLVPVQGTGYIRDEVFHFEGTVITSSGEHEIVLDGLKLSDDRRTDAC